jgi:hypothetical protein
MVLKGLRQPAALSQLDAAVRCDPVDHRTIQFDVLEEGRMVERSRSRFKGTWRHERTVVAGTGGSSVLTDNLVVESRGRLVDAYPRAVLTRTFRLRHRRLQRHFARPPSGGGSGSAT